MVGNIGGDGRDTWPDGMMDFGREQHQSGDNRKRGHKSIPGGGQLPNM